MPHRNTQQSPDDQTVVHLGRLLGSTSKTSEKKGKIRNILNMREWPPYVHYHVRSAPAPLRSVLVHGQSADQRGSWQI